MTDPSPSVPVESREQPSGIRSQTSTPARSPWPNAETSAPSFYDQTRGGLLTTPSADDLLHARIQQLTAERDRARDLAAHLRGQIEAALAFQDEKRGVSCAGYSVDDDGCFVADLAARIRTAIATHDVQAAITAAALAAHLEAEQAEEQRP